MNLTERSTRQWPYLYFVTTHSVAAEYSAAANNRLPQSASASWTVGQLVSGAENLRERAAVKIMVSKSAEPDAVAKDGWVFLRSTMSIERARP